LIDPPLHCRKHTEPQYSRVAVSVFRARRLSEVKTDCMKMRSTSTLAFPEIAVGSTFGATYSLG
jgi:hypothetical protein